MNKNKKLHSNRWNASKICFIAFFLVMLILFGQLCYLGLSTKVYGTNMKEFASKRNTVSEILTAERGTIYDVQGNVLAQNISSYTLIAYLDPSRTKDENNPQHVIDKEYTAVKLASVLGEDNYEYILERLNKQSKQVEFGNVGKNLTELTKLAIEELELPGISFVSTIKRYYPNGNFAPYIIGYAKQYSRINIKVGEEYDLYNYYKTFFNNYDNVTVDVLNESVVSIDNTIIKGLKNGSSIILIKTNGETLANIVINVIDYDAIVTMDTTIVGELGIEANYEKELEGVDGYITYQQDKYGYKIPDTPEDKVEAKNGYDIYLTIDSNIQRFAENTIKKISENFNPKWSIVTVMDAKTGELLASATSPSYNPNSLPKNMSYQNPLVSYTYEPGSVMKVYTYMCAIETGKYDGDKKYLSGSYEFDDDYVIHDWNNAGWGYLSYDSGFSYSSNVAIINIIKDYLSASELKNCLEKYGFNNKTGVELSNEEAGNISFKYETEVMSAGFGQGISATPIQQLQALTVIANDGVMVKPHIIDKMVNRNTGEEIKTKVEKSEKIVNSSTVSKMKDLMESVIQPGAPTGSKYYIEGFDIIGKTGTAQIYENGKYLTGENDYIMSVALMYPKDDPQIIIYAATKQPETRANYALTETIPELIQNISKYKKMFVDESKEENNKSYKTSIYKSRDISNVKEELESNNLNVIIIGDGNKIIKQYPEKGVNVISGDKIYLLTNGTNYTIPDMTNWSRFDVIKFCELAKINYSFDGYGYVVNQSISPGSNIGADTTLEILLGNIKAT